MLREDKGERDRFITINKLKTISFHGRYHLLCHNTCGLVPPVLQLLQSSPEPSYLWLGNMPPRFRTDGFPSPSLPGGKSATHPRQGAKSALALFVQSRERELDPSKEGQAEQKQVKEAVEEGGKKPG